MKGGKAGELYGSKRWRPWNAPDSMRWHDANALIQLCFEVPAAVNTH